MQKKKKVWLVLCQKGLVVEYQFFKQTLTLWMNYFFNQIPPDSNSADPTSAQKQVITCLTVSPSEETLVASTNQSQLYYITLPSADLGRVSALSSFLHTYFVIEVYKVGFYKNSHNLKAMIYVPAIRGSYAM